VYFAFVGKTVILLACGGSRRTAFGGVQEIARRADANPNTMYRTLSEQGNLWLRTLRAILSSMGLRLAVQPITAGKT